MASVSRSLASLASLALRAPAAAGLRATGLVPASRQIANASGSFRLVLRGLPFSARVPEVERFFREFRTAPLGPGGKTVDILRSRGRPTGRAFIYFDDVVEAMRAKDALHGQPFCLVGPSVYRMEVFEDFPGRAIVRDEDSPGDIVREKLLDEMRDDMVGVKYRDKIRSREKVKDQY
mmetsp:Transcript_34455/g.75204  ORF Transcript_34455/g.75204 Transcript_34455/m.75204 type:complete len:177 (-) Transcript_34455:81-611(-)